MSTLIWDPEWETGVPSIDEQHRKLFEQMDVLLAAVQDQEAEARIPGLLAFLAMYVDVHFRDEERAMERTNYSELARHQAVHNAMRKRVAELVFQYQQDPGSLTAPVLQFLMQWLLDHIGVEDRRMAKHLLMWEREHARPAIPS